MRSEPQRAREKQMEHHLLKEANANADVVRLLKMKASPYSKRRTRIGGEFWEGDATKHFSESKVFSVKGGEAFSE